MPLLHQPVTRPLGLNRQAVEHTRLANSKVADVDHFLHFAFALGNDFSCLERHELTKLVFHFTQSVAKPANGLASHRRGRDPPF